MQPQSSRRDKHLPPQLKQRSGCEAARRYILSIIYGCRWMIQWNLNVDLVRSGVDNYEEPIDMY